jgi:hypothetical protein
MDRPVDRRFCLVPASWSTTAAPANYPEVGEHNGSPALKAPNFAPRSSIGRDAFARAGNTGMTNRRMLDFFG